MKKISFIFIFFLFSSSLLADDNKKEIDKLFVQLKSALNFENSKKIEDKIWDLWTTHPTKNKRMNFKSKLPNDLENILKSLRNA